MRTLLLALAIMGAAAGQTFPHAVHLAKARLACADCHAAALHSTRVGDNLAPAPEVCRKCHENAAIGPARPARVAHFNHELHLKLGNLAPVIAAAIDRKTYLSPGPPAARAELDTQNACVACHRGTALSAHMADCLVCHNQIDPPYSCEFCHAKGARLAPAGHTSDFLDTHSTGKLPLDKTTCALCHGRSFHCLGCH